MSLSIALSDALSGLRATQAQLQVISGNIANAQTPGYSTETLPQEAMTNPNGGVGVETGVAQRVTDQALSANLLSQTTSATAASTTNDYYTQVVNLLGQVNGSNTIANALSSFSSAMQALATTPQDPVAQSAAVAAGQSLTQNLNSLATGVQTLRQNADTQIGTSVTTLNNALNSIATLNGQIAEEQATGQSTAALQDTQQQALSQVAQLVGVQSYTAANGAVTVATNSGQTLVSGTTASQFGFTPAGLVNSGTALSGITLGGTDVTSQFTTGQIGALLQMRNTTLPGVTAQLNQFANNLFNVSSTPALATTNSGLNATNDANDVFANVDTANGTDNAATIEVNPSLVSNPSLLYTGTGGNDPTISQTLANNLNNAVTFAPAGGLAASTTSTLSSYAADMIGQNATASAAATQNSTYQTSMQTQMQNQLQSETGVNLDQQLANLTIYQNAYGASARVISTIQTMYDALMNIST